MKRITLLAIFATASIAALTPALASAKIVELGAVSSAPIVAPSCPPTLAASACKIVLERTTAVQTVTNGVINPTKVKANGWIVAFTIGLSNLSSNSKTALGYLKGLDKLYGTPRAQLTVLKPGKNNTYTVTAQSAVFHLTPFLGQVLQEPLSLPPTFTSFTALPVTKGEVIGLTTSTWVPVLSFNLNTTKYAYRQSRTTNCTQSPQSQTAQTTVGSSTRYLCDYPGTRVEFSATEITNTPYPKKYVH